jgi:hypothetical protein
MSLTTTSLLTASLKGKLQLEALTPVEQFLLWVLVLPSILSEAPTSPRSESLAPLISTSPTKLSGDTFLRRIADAQYQ